MFFFGHLSVGMKWPIYQQKYFCFVHSWSQRNLDIAGRKRSNWATLCLLQDTIWEHCQADAFITPEDVRNFLPLKKPFEKDYDNIVCIYYFGVYLTLHKIDITMLNKTNYMDWSFVPKLIDVGDVKDNNSKELFVKK